MGGDCTGGNGRDEHQTHSSEGVGLCGPRARMDCRGMGKDIGAEKDAEVPEIKVGRQRDTVGRSPGFGLVVDVETVTY